MTSTGTLSRTKEFFLRSGALREARTAQGAAAAAPTKTRALQQARLLTELARRVAEPVEALPPGSVPSVLITLYRDATHLALVAVRGDDAPMADLAGEWAVTDPERLARAAGDAAKAEAVRDLLIAKSGPGHVDEPTSADATLARTFVEALLWELDAPTRRVGDLRLQRWIRLGAVVVVIAALVFGIQRLSLGPNLAAGKPFHLSSNWPPCDAPMKCAQLLFHTEQQDNPWFEYDLGEPTRVHRVEVTNRSDCCSERVVPLVVELSDDHQNWKEVARQTKDFTTWTAKFPAQKTRYVRLRIPRNTVFHLEEVTVR